MALTSAKLPAPLRLQARPSSIRTLSTVEAHAQLAAFLASDASTLVAGAAGTGATRASIVRLVKGLKETIDAKPNVTTATESRVKPDLDAAPKKRRKSEGAPGQKDKKRRKTVA
ncbi:hypothetical protein BMF94_4985 [Rhodotorula taiwanensis]|uniref:Uncharacterized protein n=1 Tax=Rhodotorula taiwanensis TaxID=741276 RepID=A0A2S5B5D9_9BASI|nr:hypothetical protein BMF94_4985 [Rhodotorula taiwanensis]